MVLPSGDHTGWRASLKISVTRRAAPPEAGRTQMLPCRSMASHLPSGETATAMEVPSLTVMVTGLATANGPNAATKNAAAEMAQDFVTARRAALQNPDFARDGF